MTRSLEKRVLPVLLVCDHAAYIPAASVQGCSLLLGCLERPLCKLPAHAKISCFSEYPFTKMKLRLAGHEAVYTHR